MFILCNVVICMIDISALLGRHIDNEVYILSLNPSRTREAKEYRRFQSHRIMEKTNYCHGRLAF